MRFKPEDSSEYAHQPSAVLVCQECGSMWPCHAQRLDAAAADAALRAYFRELEPEWLAAVDLDAYFYALQPADHELELSPAEAFS